MFYRLKGPFLASYYAIFAYKLNTLIGLFTQLVSFFIQYYLWLAVFKSHQGDFFGLEQGQYLTYICGGLLIGQLTQHGTDRALSMAIRTGDVIFNLVRPLNIVLQMFAAALGRQAAMGYTLLPLLVVFLIYVDLTTLNAAQLGYFTISLGLAFVLSFQVSFLFGLIAFYTTNTWGLYLLRMNLFPILSGQIIAVSMLAGIAQTGEGLLSMVSGIFYWLAYATPLQATFFTPSSILSGMMVGQEMWLHMGLQVCWILLLLVLSSRLFNNLISKFNIQGA